MGSKMTCQNRGLWHLGISAEACENAGGEWYRTPCVTLRDCIADRPARFDLDNPQTNGCKDEDGIGVLKKAFVYASTDHDDFTFEATKEGCHEFCRSLPDYGLQIGMEIEGSESNTDRCICLYNDGKAPPQESLPNYAVRSLPKFSIMDETGKLGLGVSRSSDCTGNDVGITYQKHTGGAYQEFQLTYDSRIVSVMCPELVLTAYGNHIVSMPPRFDEFDDFSRQEQQWSFNNDGSITNVAYPEKKISAMKEDGRFTSFYFSLESSKTHLAMAIASPNEACVEGVKIELQEPNGSPKQHFFVAGEDSYFLACGSSLNADGACAGKNNVAAASEKHPLRCCKDSALDPGSDWQRKYHETCPENVWGTSFDPNLVSSAIAGCYHSVDFNEGKEICENAGGESQMAELVRRYSPLMISSHPSVLV